MVTYEQPSSPSVLWRAPQPLWAGGDLSTPALLRFASDDFMAELATHLAEDGSGAGPGLGQLLARPESWRDDGVALFAVPDPGPPVHPDELTLYQPAHGRFYLVAATLACRRYGYPDRRLREKEEAGFVLRRLVPTVQGTTPDPGQAGSFSEYGWTTEGHWQVVTGPQPVEGEEILPLATTSYTTAGRRRRLLTGFLPVAARERYEGRPAVGTTVEDDGDGDPLADARVALLVSTVVEPLAAMRARATPSNGPDPALAEPLILAALDLGDLLIEFSIPPGDVGVLTEVLFDGGGTWQEAVAEVSAARDDILAGDPPELTLSRLVPGEDEDPSGARLGDAIDLLRGSTPPGAPLDRWQLVTQFAAELPEVDDDPLLEAGDDPAPADPASGAWYAVRCVYRRCDCARFRPEWMSPLSEPFRLASFFDPDAPARDVSIPLPVDTSPSGLRKFPRNVRVALSQQLRRQMSQVGSIGDLENGTADAPRGSFGMVCQLSIPIITICALVLLMIVVALLNIVFFWLPFFKVCLPRRES